MPCSTTTPSCGNVEGLPFEDRCNFVKNSGLCDSHTQFINYIYLQFCIFNPTSSGIRQIISYILNLIICVYYFLILAVAADKFFCPALSTLGKLLKLNENIAGLTLLALGNSSPDFLSCFTTLNHENPILFSQIIGGGLFVTTLIGGIIICIKPFKLNPMIFLRDSLFLLISILLLEIFLQPDYVITIRECMFVFMDQHYAKRSGEALEMKFSSQNIVYTVEDWKKSGLFGRCLIILSMPSTFVLKLFIPIVDHDQLKSGWCHLLNSIQISILPLFLIIYSIIGSVYVIWAIAHEILNIIALLAIVFRLSPAFIGCTLLSWGNCVGDLMADIALSKRGYQEMAYSATFGSPMFSILFKIPVGSLSSNCSTFLIISLSSTIIALSLTNFTARRSLGIFLILFYIIFLIGTMAAHFEIIHAYGTDHNIDYRFQDGETLVSFF
ncbi:putative sodium/calcium exchanger 7 [Condylostylus longicornis]|uniref:putative sodium/calcium exchanger 7 n=1 Tax=Condylostylus longicornis TaxID=2530218 RepID=UPI00244DA49B|nr:putative sodium/calcium exchanger 7 [Condylostylus longicornis]